MSNLPSDYFEPILSGQAKWQKEKDFSLPQYKSLRYPSKRKRRHYPLRECRTCNVVFAPMRSNQSVCTGGRTCLWLAGHPEKECSSCNSVFTPTRGNQKYCSDGCRKVIQRMWERISQRKRRAKMTPQQKLVELEKQRGYQKRFKAKVTQPHKSRSKV